MDDIAAIDIDGEKLVDGHKRKELTKLVKSFVIRNVEGITYNRVPLFEHHAPYTQKTGGDKFVDDVLDEDWSLNVNKENSDLNFHTLSQHIHFELRV